MPILDKANQKLQSIHLWDERICFKLYYSTRTAISFFLHLLMQVFYLNFLIQLSHFTSFKSLQVD